MGKNQFSAPSAIQVIKRFCSNLYLLGCASPKQVTELDLLGHNLHLKVERPAVEKKKSIFTQKQKHSIQLIIKDLKTATSTLV